MGFNSALKGYTGREDWSYGIFSSHSIFFLCQYGLFYNVLLEETLYSRDHVCSNILPHAHTHIVFSERTTDMYV